MITSPYQVEIGARIMVLLEQPEKNTFKQIQLNSAQYNAILQYIVKEFSDNNMVLNKLKLSKEQITHEVFKGLNAIN